MSRYNTPQPRRNQTPARRGTPLVAQARKATSAIVTEDHASGRNANGGSGYARDLKSELHLLGITNMVDQDTFYEVAKDRDSRFAELCRLVGGLDPQWMTHWIRHLRQDIGMRTAPMIAADWAIRGMSAVVGQNEFSGKYLVDAALQRPDELGEALSYYRATWGNKLGVAWRKGVAMAARRMLTEQNFLKYDKPDSPMPMGRMLELVRPLPRDEVQDELFGYIVDERRNGKNAAFDPELLPMIERHNKMMAWPQEKKEAFFTKKNAAEKLALAGITHEELSGWLGHAPTAEQWAVMIRSMRYQALRMNLNAFSRADLDSDAIAYVCERLSDASEVRQAKQWPMQLLGTHRATSHNFTWSAALEQAIQNSLSNVPALPGLTLIMVDTSTSMENKLSDKSDLMRWDAAVIFALAQARRCETVEVVSFSSNQMWMGDQPGARTKVFPPGKPGESLLKSVDRWQEGGYFLGGGTDTARALQRHYHGHDRVMIVTDEQNGNDPHSIDDLVPRNIPMYTWNLAGYRHGHAPSGSRNRHVIGGFSDQAFRQIEMLERGENAPWPWEQ